MARFQITIPDEIAEKISQKCSDVGMTKSELVREAMRLAYGISEEDTETRKEEYKIYLTKDNYDYLFRCCFPTANADTKAWYQMNDNVEDFVNKNFIPDMRKMVAQVWDMSLSNFEIAQVYNGNYWNHYHNGES